MRRALRDDVISSLVAGSGLPWGPIDVLPRCGSTNAELLADATPWRVVTTDHQVSGRGRLARAWETPALSAIALSAAVPVPAGRVPDIGWLPLVTGLAVRAALASVGLDAVLKWPNDVLVPARAGAADPRDGKVCGILCELAPAAGPAGPGDRLVVIGLGINVDQTTAELPDLPGPVRATSLALEGCVDVDRDVLVGAVLRELGTRHSAWAAGGLAHQRLVAEYAGACATVGRTVEVHLPDGSVDRGTAERVDADGRLVVRGPGGERAHAAGDVVHARHAGPAPATEAP